MKRIVFKNEYSKPQTKIGTKKIKKDNNINISDHKMNIIIFTRSNIKRKNGKGKNQNTFFNKKNHS